MRSRYTGRALRKPLGRLLRHLLGEQDRQRKDLLTYAHDNENDFVRWATTSDTQTTAERNGKARKFLQTMRQVRETELWLWESIRCPRQTWTLDTEQLAALYPVQIAPETTADELLRERKAWW